MRGKPAVLVSLAVHGVALAFAARWAVGHAVGPRALHTSTLALAQPPPQVAEAIAVEFFADTSVASDTSAASDARAASAGHGRADRPGGSPGVHGDARIAGVRAGGPGEIVGREPGAGSRWMKMRGPELGVGGGFLEKFLLNSKPLEVIQKSGRVEPAGGGTSVIRDRVTRVTIDRDGTAHFHDKPDIDIHFDLHLPTPAELLREMRQVGRDVATWYADPYKLARVGTVQDVPRHIAATPGACDSWLDACSTELRLREKPESEDRGDAVAHGKLDLTDMLMRKFVGDPYASRKRALLDHSLDERADIGARHAKEDLARSTELMQQNLEALWRMTSEPEARRQALFTLWDECGEGDGPVGEAGERARLFVIGWIRAKLPAGSPGAFTADDIARFAAQRTSKQAFVPYE